MNTNVNIERRIHELFDTASIDSDLNPVLKQLYKETLYPGVLYWMAYNYEMGLYGVEDEDKAIHYYTRAGKEGYIDAMLWLAEYYMELDKDEIFMARYWAQKAFSCSDSLYAQYILAKIYLLEAIHFNTYGLYRKAVRIMNQLADKDYLPAQEFLQTDEEIEDVNFSSMLDDLIDLDNDLFDEDIEE